MLPQSNPLQLVQAVLVGRAVDHGILEQVAVDGVVVDGGLGSRGGGVVLLHQQLGVDPGTAGRLGLLELPRVVALVVQEARIVVALVEVFEDGGEDLGLVFGQGDAARRTAGASGLLVLFVEDLAVQDLLEVGRDAEDVFVGGKDALVAADDERDDGRSQGSEELGREERGGREEEDKRRRTRGREEKGEGKRKHTEREKESVRQKP